MKGSELRRFRKRLTKTQAELAGALGMQTNSVARMERDERPIMKTTELAVRFLLIMKSKRGGKAK